MRNVEINFSLEATDGSNVLFTTNGTLEQINNILRLQFIEQTELKANTIVDIYQDKVIIKRSGPVEMQMEYIMNEDTIAHLTTDFNYQLSMNNHTDYLEINDNQIQIVYQTEFDKEQKITHKLVIKWTLIN